MARNRLTGAGWGSRNLYYNECARTRFWAFMINPRTMEHLKSNHETFGNIITHTIEGYCGHCDSKVRRGTICGALLKALDSSPVEPRFEKISENLYPNYLTPPTARRSKHGSRKKR